MQKANAEMTFQRFASIYDNFAVTALKELMREDSSEEAGNLAALAWQIADAMIMQRGKRGLNLNTDDKK